MPDHKARLRRFGTLLPEVALFEDCNLCAVHAKRVTSSWAPATA